MQANHAESVMTDVAPNDLAASLAKVDLTALRQTYNEQDEFVVLERCLGPELLGQWERELEQLKPHVHRNFVPKHKKGGSVPYQLVHQLAPSISGLYHDPAFIELLRKLADAPMKECPDSDPHRCALYAYTEEGDHIGWHYDTSYYKDRRWTVLVGLVDRSSSRLECKLRTRMEGSTPQELALRIEPGTVVVFNGDKVLHRVTPIEAGEERFIISMQYVTRPDMNPFLRLFSNMKDAFAYFGLKQVFLGRGQKRSGATATQTDRSLQAASTSGRPDVSKNKRRR
jgi:alkylated DNA repair dioxygenase AlkB